MIFEDAHWADPTSLEVFGWIVDRIRRRGVLLLVTFRPEFDAPWVDRSYVSSLTLSRLGEREIVAMIDRVVGNNPLPAHMRQDIIERTDGIPLFVEEMTKAVLEARSEGAAQQTGAATPSSMLAVPASLQASLMARLDRLGSAKEVAQVGAVIGREFSHALLSCASRVAHFTLALPKRWKVSSLTLPRTNPNCWHVIVLRPGRSRRPQVCGGRRDSGRLSARC